MSRCEPPEGLRERGGWHRLSWANNDPGYYRWNVMEINGHKIGLWCGLEFTMENTPERAFSAGYRYIAPVPSPEELGALVRAAREVVTFLALYTLENEQVNILSAALAPFKETFDGQ